MADLQPGPNTCHPNGQPHDAEAHGNTGNEADHVRHPGLLKLEAGTWKQSAMIEPGGIVVAELHLPLIFLRVWIDRSLHLYVVSIQDLLTISWGNQAHQKHNQEWRHDDGWLFENPQGFAAHAS